MDETAIFIFLLIGVWILINWLLFPFVVSKELENIRKAIEELGDK